MKFLNEIRTWFGRRELKGMLAMPRKKVARNLSTARSMGLVYEEKGEAYFVLVKQYVQMLKSEYGVREVLAMSYINDKKKVPHYQVHRLKYDYFTSGQLDWKMRPGGDEVNRFIESDFDILLDLERDSCLPLKFVIAQSKANFKVGCYTEEWQELYDLMLKTGSKTTFDGYIEQVNHYLNMIRPVNARA